MDLDGLIKDLAVWETHLGHHKTMVQSYAEKVKLTKAQIKETVQVERDRVEAIEAAEDAQAKAKVKPEPEPE